MRLSVALIVVLALLSQVPLIAQADRFDVASVRLNNTADTATALGFGSDGRFRAVNETLWRLIAEAYGPNSPLPRERILGGPEWIDADRFDVDARAAAPVGDPELRRLMLRALLAERFNLVVREETREQPTFELVIRSAGGELGPQLRRSTADCAVMRCLIQFGRGRNVGTGSSLRQLADLALSRFVGRPVVDRTVTVVVIERADRPSPN